MAKADAYHEANRIKEEQRRAEINEAAPHKGDNVLIKGFVRGKNAAINEKVGEIFWIGADQYKPGYTIGVKVEGEKFFVPANRAYKGDMRCDEAIMKLEVFNKVRGSSRAY